jgi:hypothetical protein
VLPEQAQLHVAGVVSIVAVDHDPVLATASGLSQGADPLDGGRGRRIGQPPVDEVHDVLSDLRPSWPG